MIGIVGGVEDLDAVEAGINQLGECRVKVGNRKRMRQHRRAAGQVDQANRVHRRQAWALDVAGPPAVQQTLERVVDRGSLPMAYQHPSDVGAADGTVAGELLNLGTVDRNADRGKLLNHAHDPARAPFAKVAQPMLKFGMMVVDEVTEQMQLARCYRGTQLDAGDDGDAERRAARGRLVEPGGRVVVGNG